MDRLPFELQFQCLLELPTQDILSYCKTSRTTYLICGSTGFWSRKAKHNFDLPLIGSPTDSLAKQYEQTLRLLNNPQSLLLTLIKTGHSLPLWLIARCNIKKVVPLAVEHNNAAIFEQLLPLIVDDQDALRDVFIASIAHDQPEMEKGLLKYYNPDTEQAKQFTVYFIKAIVHKQHRLLRYLELFVLDHIYPELALEIAFLTNDRETIDYIAYLFSNFLEEDNAVRSLAGSLIVKGNWEALKLLIDATRANFDYEFAIQYAKREYSHWMVPLLEREMQ